MDKNLVQHGIASIFGYDKKEYSQNINLSKMLHIGMENNNNYQKLIHISVKNKLDLHLSGTKFKGIKIEGGKWIIDGVLIVSSHGNDAVMVNLQSKFILC